MRVLVTIKRSPAQRYLVHLITQELIHEVKSLINNKRHSQAIVTILSKGILERKVSNEELPIIKADLVLSERNAHWDLVK